MSSDEETSIIYLFKIDDFDASRKSVATTYQKVNILQVLVLKLFSRPLNP